MLNSDPQTFWQFAVVLSTTSIMLTLFTLFVFSWAFRGLAEFLNAIVMVVSVNYVIQPEIMKVHFAAMEKFSTLTYWGLSIVVVFMWLVGVVLGIVIWSKGKDFYWRWRSSRRRLAH